MVGGYYFFDYDKRVEFKTDNNNEQIFYFFLELFVGFFIENQIFFGSTFVLYGLNMNNKVQTLSKNRTFATVLFRNAYSYSMDTIREEGSFKYLEVGPEDGEVLLLLHGLFGALSNFQGITGHFQKTHRVIVPILPILELPIKEVSVTALVEYVRDFVDFKGFDKVNVLGNSLGGHVALLYVLDHPDKVSSVILTGSSGLFESAFGTGFPQRGNYEYIKKKTEDTFYSPEIATKELVDEVFLTVSDRNRAIRVIKTAKSAVRHNLGDKLHVIKAHHLWLQISSMN